MKQNHLHLLSTHRWTEMLISIYPSAILLLETLWGVDTRVLYLWLVHLQLTSRNLQASRILLSSICAHAATLDELWWASYFSNESIHYLELLGTCVCWHASTLLGCLGFDQLRAVSLRGIKQSLISKVWFFLEVAFIYEKDWALETSIQFMRQVHKLSPEIPFRLVLHFSLNRAKDGVIHPYHLLFIMHWSALRKH